MRFPILLAIYEAILYLSNDAYLPALPAIAVALGVSHAVVQLSLTTWFLGASSTQLIIGPLSDRYGRRPILFTGGICFIIACVLSARTHSANLLLLLRFIQGVCVTSMVVPSNAAVHESFHEKVAIKIMALMSSITIVAPALGPLFGAFILHLSDWRWIFGTLAVLALVILTLLAIAMPETHPKENRTSLHLGKILRNYQSIFTNSRYMLAALSICSLFGACIAWIAAGPFLVITKFHLSYFWFSSFQLLVFFCVVLGNRSVGRLLNEYDKHIVAWQAFCIALLGALLALCGASISPHTLFWTITGMMIISYASGIGFPILNRVAIESSDAPMGIRTAIFSCMVSGFGMLASAIITFVYSGTLLSLSLVLTCFVAAALLFYTLRR